MKKYFDKALEQFKIDFQDRNLMIFYDELATDETLYDYIEEAYAKSSLPMLYASIEDDSLNELFCELALYDLALGCISRRKNLWGEEYEPIKYWLNKGLDKVVEKFRKSGSIFDSIKTAQEFAKKYCQQENNLPLMAVSPLGSKILKSNLLPLRECPECNQITLATYSIKRGLGIHSIKAVCINRECLFPTFMETNRELLKFFRTNVEKQPSIPIRFGLRNHTRFNF